MTYTSHSMIQPRDFSEDTTDALRDLWTGGKIRHLAAALEGREVVMVLDTQTGFAARGVLVGWREELHTAGRVLFRHSERGQTTAYRIQECGVVMDEYAYPQKAAKWVALDTWMSERSKAVQDCYADPAWMDTIPEGESWTFDTEPTGRDGEVLVSLTSQPQGTLERPWRRRGDTRKWGYVTVTI